MAFFQRQLIDPTPAEVEAALRVARNSCGGKDPATNEIRDALARSQREADGSVRWGPSGRPNRPRWVACHWWTDHAGRKHWYVESDFYPPNGPPDPLWRCRHEAVHPLCVIDPLHVVLRGEGTLLVVCDCGEIGTPEELGWSGECCGPCHDRRAEGTGSSERVAIHAHRASVRGLAFCEDGRIVSVGRDGSVHRFDPRRGEGSLLIPPSDRGGAGLVALPEGRVAVAFIRAEVVCLGVDSGEEQWRAECPGEVMGLAVSPAGDLIAVDMVDVPYLIDADTGEVERFMDGTSEFAFGPDGLLYAYDSNYPEILALQPAVGDVAETGLEFAVAEEDSCYALACSPAGGLLAAGLHGGRVRVGDPVEGRWLYTVQRPATLVMSLAFSPDGETLATAHGKAVYFWDVRTGRERGCLSLPVGGHVCLAFSGDGETLAVGDDHGVVRLWPWWELLEREE